MGTSKLNTVSVYDLRSAASAWRRNAQEASMHWAASGWFRWLMAEPELSVYDRIDDLVNEIVSLREALGKARGFVEAAEDDDAASNAQRRSLLSDIEGLGVKCED